MIQKTKDYGIFKLRGDNRDGGIRQGHVDFLKESITKCNLLSRRPILCNGDMEIVDGQHRYMAAKQLGIEIYYEVDETLKAEDVISLNSSKAWTTRDYMHFFVVNHYPEYLKLNDFVKKNNIDLRVAIKLTQNFKDRQKNDFRNGLYRYADDEFGNTFDICWETIDYIKRMIGSSKCNYLNTNKFWAALIKLVRHAEFNIERWRANLGRFSDKFSAKASETDYIKLLMEIHNWRCQNKIDLLE